MSGLLLLLAFVAPVLVVGGVAVLRSGRPAAPGSVPAGDRRFRARSQRVREGLVAELQPLGAAVAIVFAGMGMSIAIFWPLGAVIARIQRPIDYPLFDVAQQILSQDPRGWLATVSTNVTMMGDLVPMAIVTAIAMVVFAALWRHRGWWVPPLVIGSALFVELSLQRLLAVVVDRGHPPAAFGTYPSGGSARLLSSGGVIAYFVILTWPSLPARARTALWVLVALLAATEGFTRIYLLQHYPTDVPAGWLFGLLLLLTMLASASALTSHRAGTGEISPAS